MRELLGQILGWVIVTITCWFIALSIMCYSLASINPLMWTVEQRATHLGLQLGFIAAFALYRYWSTREK